MGIGHLCGHLRFSLVQKNHSVLPTHAKKFAESAGRGSRQWSLLEDHIKRGKPLPLTESGLP
ncbi:hypothetical protein ARTHRO8AJ_380023 [Arthrobacter sp. 8AJ]|nr:hypothetical protein ARTHRO8AJ_380023 [Arthrobacter sp. 8AJ]